MPVPADPNVFPTISDTQHFEAQLGNILKAHDQVYVWFFGSEMDANEQSWCLECVTSDPWITSAYRQSAIDGHPVTLVQARVGTKEAWESQSHPYRKFVKSVPTLVRWTKAGPQNRLDKFGDLTSLDSLKEFFESK